MATAKDLRLEFQSFLEMGDIAFQVVSGASNVVGVRCETDTGGVNVFICFIESDDDAPSVHFKALVGTPCAIDKPINKDELWDPFPPDEPAIVLAAVINKDELWDPFPPPNPDYWKSKYCIACNDWNRNHRWANFFIDEDEDVCASFDATVSPGTVGEECFGTMRFLVANVDLFRSENSWIFDEPDWEEDGSATF